MKQFMTDSGPVKQVRINGYNFGDRHLEDVYFICEIINDKVKVIKVDPDALDYFNKLNTKMWLEEAQNFAEKNDIFDINGDDAWIEEV